MRRFAVWVLALGTVHTAAAQKPVSTASPAGEPAASWTQFRGNPRLTGIAASVPPAALKLHWTFEAGDAIESSAAIADGVVYVGSAKGDLLAIDLAAGKLKW